MQPELRKVMPLCGLVLAVGVMRGQFPQGTLPPSGNNQKASVTQYIGPVKVTIDYSSPAVHSPAGVDRRGKIWGQLVPYGLTDLGFNNGELSPWRGGANENTVFAVSHPVMVQGKPLAAGRYGLHWIAGQSEWTLIFSKNAGAWGSFFYDESEDALRVTLKPKKHEYREWLTYEFTRRMPDEAEAELQWEELAVAWTINVPDVKEIYFTQARQKLTAEMGFQWQAYTAAAQYLAQEGIHLEEALKWANAAVAMRFVGQENFETLSTKALVLSKMGRDAESKKVMQTALRHPTASILEIHQYGRQLLSAGKKTEALEVFQLNAERNGDKWPVHVGLARGYAAAGDNAKALKHARKALEQAPDSLNRQNLEGMVKTLSEGGTYKQ